jgi:hypothetical protein
LDVDAAAGLGAGEDDAVERHARALPQRLPDLLHVGPDRLEALGRNVPGQSSSVFTPRTRDTLKLRVARGVPVADYIGTSIELRGAARGRYKAWLLLVETLPAGTEGSPVERNLVRNAFMTDWKGGVPREYELRPMRLAEGVKPSRLRVVGWIEDAKGRIRAIAQSRCQP